MNNFTVADPFMRALFASQHADNQDAAMLESANSKKEKTTDKEH